MSDLRTRLIHAFQTTEVIRHEYPGRSGTWDTATRGEAERMADLCLSVLGQGATSPTPAEETQR